MKILSAIQFSPGVQLCADADAVAVDDGKLKAEDLTADWSLRSIGAIHDGMLGALLIKGTLSAPSGDRFVISEV